MERDLEVGELGSRHSWSCGEGVARGGPQRDPKTQGPGEDPLDPAWVVLSVFPSTQPTNTHALLKDSS